MTTTTMKRTSASTTTSESEGDEAAAIRVDREKVAACMTCPICNGLFADATTISECLHTFCRKCIYDKITGDTLYQCPVCNINLGGAPIEKLRADHNLQDLRAKIFSHKNPKKPKLMPSVPEDEAHALPSSGRRVKERSISSLVLGCKSSKVSANHQGGKRTTPVSIRKKKRVARGLQQHLARDVDSDGDSINGFGSPDSAKRVSLITKLTSAAASSPKKRTLKLTRLREESDDEKGDLLRPLISLVDPSTKSEPKKSFLQEADDQVELPDVDSDEIEAPKETIKELGDNKTGEVDANGNRPIPSSPASRKRYKLQGVRPRRVAVTQDLNMPAQVAVDTESESDGRFCPIWFSLIASNNQGGVPPLPQISSCYLRVKDGSLPVSTIKKYLVQKLGLASDAEVEIWLQGQPVVPTLQLHNLVEWWLQTTPAASERTDVTIGSSAKEFVMVLSYGRKTQLS